MMTEQLTETQTPATERGTRKVRVGRVVSDKMDKTVIVEVADSKAHRIYKKVIRRQSRFKAHDEQNQCRTGDLVRIAETRPLSREKHWRVVEVVEKAR
jgi:small subunit ribosomal protein S17